jgi:hypothetical protein
MYERMSICECIDGGIMDKQGHEQAEVRDN